jgi:DNA helicase HerA-like ATPase
MTNIAEVFPKGILSPELYMGEVYSVNASRVQINLTGAGAPSGSYYLGYRYGKGEVGEFVIIEGQINLVLGRVIEVWTADKKPGKEKCEAFAKIGMLGSISMDTLRIITGVKAYPRLGDRVYAAPKTFVSMIPSLMDVNLNNAVSLSLGSIGTDFQNKVQIKPEKLFGRHCAILGSTGGGKSWTISKILEESLCFQSKMLLLDATGEYRGMDMDSVTHIHLSDPVEIAEKSSKCSLPPTCFIESDFIALFEPAGKVQGPKLREAIRSLRLAMLFPNHFPEGYVEKIRKNKSTYNNCLLDPDISHQINDPKTPFNVKMLVQQIEQECVYPTGFNDDEAWGKEDGNFAYCLSLITRINGALTSQAYSSVFQDEKCFSLIDLIDEFKNNSQKRLLRLDLSGVSFEYHAREIIANVIGRHLLNKARNNDYKEAPLLVFVDEAHNFLGKHIGGEDSVTRLDAFELISKEGRKYGLNICLASQRPRDITEGVLSQMGTMIVHRLTNDRDREIIERACGELDRDASSFLPNLKPGEAVIIGCDLPIPLTIQIDKPNKPPKLSGPNYQEFWSESETKTDS